MAKDNDRERRLAAALRANLRRRKAMTRRGENVSEESGPDASDPRAQPSSPQSRRD